MKYLLSILFLLPIFIFSQFSIDLNEKEVHFCFTDDGFSPSANNVSYDSIGTNLKIYNGIPPYTYKWIINDTSLFYNGKIFTASTYLYDTNSQITRIKKDSLIISHNDTVKMYLLVTDSLNRTAKDVIILTYSKFKKSYTYLTFCSNKDTNIVYASIGGTFYGDVYKYNWSPKEYLIDDTLKQVRTTTKAGIVFTCKVTNKHQCKAEAYAEVFDLAYCSNNIEELEVNKQIVNFHSVIKNISIYNFIDKYEHYVNIFNISGRKVYDGVLKEKIPIGSILSEKGVYFMIVDDKSYKVVRE